MIEIETILLPVDFSKGSDLATTFAISLAQEYKAKLHVLHVYELVPQYDYLAKEFLEVRKTKLEEALANVIPAESKATIDVEEILAEGTPVHHTIVEKAKELGDDVIVIATHGRTGLAHVFLGSVAEHVIRHATCPVLVVRASEKSS
jgi:nucleotide-binding universal stress UspA family protein